MVRKRTRKSKMVVEVKAPPPNPRRRRRPRRPRGTGGGKGAPVTTPAAVRGLKGRAIREQGTDLIGTQPVKSGATGVIMQAVITPEMFPRMGVLGKAFQRIKYHRLRFEVVQVGPRQSPALMWRDLLRMPLTL